MWLFLYITHPVIFMLSQHSKVWLEIVCLLMLTTLWKHWRQWMDLMLIDHVLCVCNSVSCSLEIQQFSGKWQFKFSKVFSNMSTNKSHPSRLTISSPLPHTPFPHLKFPRAESISKNLCAYVTNPTGKEGRKAMGQKDKAIFRRMQMISAKYTNVFCTVSPDAEHKFRCKPCHKLHPAFNQLTIA